MKFAIIGYGSIGRRHAGNLRDLGHQVILVRHSNKNPNIDNYQEYFSLKTACSAEEHINGAIICSPTFAHLNDVLSCIQLKIPFLLEKPSTSKLKESLKIKKALKNANFSTYDIAYCLRYFPPVKAIIDFVPNLGNLYSIQVNAGQYLPQWRTDVDYSKAYSANAEMGGGVHIDISHEIDYLIKICGMPDQAYAILDKISNLNIKSPDICCAIFNYKSGAIAELHLDYLSHIKNRSCTFIGDNGTLKWDLLNNKVTYYSIESVGRDIYTLPGDYESNDMYLSEIKHFIEIIKGNAFSIVDIDQGINILKITNAIERSSKKQKKISI